MGRNRSIPEGSQGQILKPRVEFNIVLSVVCTWRTKCPCTILFPSPSSTCASYKLVLGLEVHLEKSQSEGSGKSHCASGRCSTPTATQLTATLSVQLFNF